MWLTWKYIAFMKICLFVYSLPDVSFLHHLSLCLNCFSVYFIAVFSFALLNTTSSSFVCFIALTRSDLLRNTASYVFCFMSLSVNLTACVVWRPPPPKWGRILAVVTAAVSLTWLPQSFQIRLDGHKWNWTASHSWNETAIIMMLP